MHCQQGNVWLKDIWYFSSFHFCRIVQIHFSFCRRFSLFAPWDFVSAACLSFCLAICTFYMAVCILVKILLFELNLFCALSRWHVRLTLFIFHKTMLVCSCRDSITLHLSQVKNYCHFTYCASFFLILSECLIIIKLQFFFL